MYPCHRCRRHVMVGANECPFCAAPQRNGTGPLGGFAGVLLGLTLAGCGDDGNSETGASMTQGTSETDPSTTAPTTTMTSTTEPTGTASTSTEEESAEVADYGSAGIESSTITEAESSS